MVIGALNLTVVLAVIAALIVPGASEAQRAGKAWRIGLFHVGLDHVPPSLATLREGLKALGYEEGKDVQLDWRNLPDEDAAGETAKEFVRNRVDLIVAFENQTTRAAKAATSKIPIVFLHVTDPVKDGFVKSYRQPGGNLTGFSGLGDVPAKRLEIFRELMPQLRRIIALLDPQDPVTPRELAEVRRAAAALGLRLVEHEATDQVSLERVLRSVERTDADGIFVISPTLYANFSALIVGLALERRLPLPMHRKEWVERGALFSYGLDIPSVGWGAARYVDKILKGAKPGDLPIEQLTKYELVINRRTAGLLGLQIPGTVLLRANKIVE